MSSIQSPSQSGIAADGNKPVDVSDITGALWRGRRTIILTVLVLAALAIGYSLIARPMYRAEVVLSPSGDDSMRPNLGALGGLASLAGINIGSGDKSIEAIAILKSKGFAREFIQSHNLTDAMLSARNQSWFTGARSRDIRLAVETFDQTVRRVSEDRKTGLVTLSIQWSDGVQAAKWANELVRLLNVRMRSRALDETGRNVKYLQHEMASTPVVSLQQATGRLLEAEMQKYLVANGDDEFAFKVIDAAVPPRRPSWPRPALLTALAMLVGVMCSGAYVVLRGH